MKGRGSDRQRVDWVALAVLATPLLLWELGARREWISPLLFPPPSQIGAAAWTSFTAGDGMFHLMTSVRRMVVGFLLGGTTGIILGLMMGYWSPARRLLDPLVAALHPVPKIAVLPLIMVVLGIGENTKYAVVAIAAFFPLLINSMAGVRQIHPIHFEVAHNYGAGRLSLLRWVILPGSLPLILAGTRLALNSALVITLAVELVSADQGLGRLIWEAWLTMRVENLYVGVGLAAAMGIVLNHALSQLQARVVPWQEERPV